MRNDVFIGACGLYAVTVNRGIRNGRAPRKFRLRAGRASILQRVNHGYIMAQAAADRAGCGGISWRSRSVTMRRGARREPPFSS